MLAAAQPDEIPDSRSLKFRSGVVFALYTFYETQPEPHSITRVGCNRADLDRTTGARPAAYARRRHPRLRVARTPPGLLQLFADAPAPRRR